MLKGMLSFLERDLKVPPPDSYLATTPNFILMSYVIKGPSYAERITKRVTEKKDAYLSSSPLVGQDSGIDKDT